MAIRQEKLLMFFPSTAPNSPVFIFIHGGYFKALDKRQYSFLAQPFVQSGFTVINLNYDLAPKVRVEEIVQQTCCAIAWIYSNVGRWNGDPNQLIICGHSVGAF